MLKDFKAFLFKHGVIGLAVGVIIGGAVGKLVNSLVSDLIMPIVGLLTPSGDWRAIKIGPFGVGSFAGSLLDFLIVSFVIFFIVKTILKEEPKKP